MANDVVHVTTESKWAKLFCEVVHHVELGVHTLKYNQVMFNLFAEYIVFNIHMADVGGWFSGISHSSAGIIILICNCCSYGGNSP